MALYFIYGHNKRARHIHTPTYTHKRCAHTAHKQNGGQITEASGCARRGIAPFLINLNLPVCECVYASVYVEVCMWKCV